MIVYGTSLQNKPEEAPQEVAAWLLERVTRYPNIEFKVDCWEPHHSEAEAMAEQARLFSRLFACHAPRQGASVVMFPYLRQRWHVKIIGATDRQGNIIDHRAVETGGDLLPLSASLRAEIAGMPGDAQHIGEKMYGIPRQPGDQVYDLPEQMVPLSPDWRWTSALSLTGEQFNNLLNEPEIKDDVQRALAAKDWGALKRLHQSIDN